MAGRGISWIWEDYSADHFDGRLWDLDLGFRPRHAASRHRAAKLGPTVVANPVVGFYRGFEARQFAAVHGRTAGPRHFVAATLRYLRWRVQRPREVPPSPGLWVRRIERFDDRVTRLATSALSEFDFSLVAVRVISTGVTRTRGAVTARCWPPSSATNSGAMR